MNTATPAPNPAPLRQFVQGMTELVGRETREAEILKAGRQLLAALLKSDGWLPEAFATPRPDRYAQYLLHCDPLERFSVVSFVWGPGQGTPVHNHSVWGMVGILRGAERCDEYDVRDGVPTARNAHHVMQAGDIEFVSPTVGDWHRVTNARTDGPSISIHVYGGNIGAVSRHRLDEQGCVIDFISGYDSTVVPNLWDRSKAA